MLRILLLSFFVAIVSMIIGVVVPKIISLKDDKDDIRVRIKYAIISFFIEFVFLYVYLYLSNSSQTIRTAFICMFVPFGLNSLIANHYNGKIEKYFKLTLAGISLLVFIYQIVLIPKPKLVYNHNMEKGKSVNTFSSTELSADIKLSSTDDSPFYFETAEVRRINGEDIAVYKISYYLTNSKKCIPGYVIRKDDGDFQMIYKKIYYDVSHTGKRDALKAIRRKYPTVILDNCEFDIDDDWNPYEIYTYRESIHSSNGMDYGLIILNLMDGTSEKYPVSENKIPSWVDFKLTYQK